MSESTYHWLAKKTNTAHLAFSSPNTGNTLHYSSNLTITDSSAPANTAQEGLNY